MESLIRRVRGKFYDLGTTNKSFLEVSKTLHKLGVKNYLFMLEIKDPSIANLDPFSPNLTKEQIYRIITECTRNFWYYAREVVRIPASGSDSKGIQYRLNRGSLAQAYLALHGIDTWLNLPRQQGKTVGTLVLHSWIYNFATTNSKFIYINKDGPNAKSNLNLLKSLLDALPEYMHFDAIMEEDGKITKAVKNATTIKHPITHNEVITKSRAGSYEQALSMARGLTAPIIHFDETEFTPHIKTIVANSYSTFETASRYAKKNHAPYGRFFTSTPGDLDTQMGQEAAEMLTTTCKFSDHMYDMHYDFDDNKNELLQFVAANSESRIVYIEYHWESLGLTRAWYEKMCAGINDPITIKREILLQRIRGNNNSPYDPDAIQYIIDHVKPIIQEIYIKDYYRFDVYEKLVPTIPYLVGVDCSTGTGKDNNAITIINPYTVKPVAEFSCPYIGETKYEELLIELVRKYIPRSIVIIERNSVGDGIIDHLMNSEIVYNLYYDKNKDLMAQKFNDFSSVESMLKHETSKKSFYGVYTGPKSRETMMAILSRHMTEFKDNFVCQKLTDDICRLIRTNTGRIEAGPGFHDDNVMSYLIAMYVYYNGNNLAAFGYIKGQTIIEESRPAMTFRDLDPGVLPDDVIRAMEEQEATRIENDYASIYKNAVAQAQHESMALYKHGLVRNSTLNHSRDDQIESIGYDLSDGDLELFDELNSF